MSKYGPKNYLHAGIMHKDGIERTICGAAGIFAPRRMVHYWLKTPDDVRCPACLKHPDFVLYILTQV